VTLPVRSLRNKLLLFAAVLVVLPGIMVGVIAERSGRASLQTVIGRQLAREAGHAAEQLAAALAAERRSLNGLARQDLMREIRVADIDKRIASALATLREASAARIEYLVEDETGTVVASSDPGRLDLPLPASLGDAGAERIGGPLEAAAFGRTALWMRTPIPDPDDPSRSLGWLTGIFDWQRLLATTASLRRELADQGLAADVLVARSDGTLLGASWSSTPPEDPDRALWSSRLVLGFSGPPDYRVDEDGGLLAGRAEVGGELAGSRLLVVAPLDEALAPAHRLTSRLAVVLGIALSAALAFAALASRRVVRPLSELTEAIRGLSRGDMGNLQVPVRSEDEVGTLAAAFNQMASELDRVQSDLIEAEKFAFVGELASGVAHEVRTSLGVLRSATQILQRSLPQGSEAASSELVEMMRAEVDRLSRVVDDLLTLDRPKPLHLDAVVVSQVVFGAADFVEPRAREKGVHVDRVSAADEVAVRCDPELIHQVAVNLLVNAIDVLERGGRVAVRILPPQAGFAGFEVSDDGPGIPPALRDRIFRPFVTAREGGVGLGLTFVKRVVHDHRGRVSVASAEGPGTCIRIELPVAADPAPQERRP